MTENIAAVEITPEYLAELTRPRRVHWWGSEYDITPALLHKALGDGQQVIALQPLDTRPNYYVVCVDSSWQLSNYSDPEDGPVFCDELDCVLGAIEEEYGNCDDDEYDDDNQILLDEKGDPVRPGWPALSCGSGESWWSLMPEEVSYV